MQEKIVTANIRRNTMIQIQQVNLTKMTEVWNTKIHQHAVAHELVDVSIKRKKKWLTLLTAVNRFIILGKMIDSVRDARDKNVKKWRAVLTIQRYWRKFCPSAKRAMKSGKRRESMLVGLRKRLGGQGNQKMMLYQARVNACTVIITFLRNKGFKVAVLQFIW